MSSLTRGLPLTARKQPSGTDLLATVEAVFVPADPPRRASFALWRSDGAPPDGADDELELAFPVGEEIVAGPVPVALVPAAELLDLLLAMPADAAVGPSILAWARAAHIAVELVARGRLTPGISDAGHDTWRLGPLDPDDVRRRVDLAAALPPEAHCQVLAAPGPLRVASPRALLDAFADTVADLVPRTSAAGRFAGHRAFADPEPQPVEHAADWFATTVSGGARTTVTLRLVLPPGAPAGTAPVTGGSIDDDSDDRTDSGVGDDRVEAAPTPFEAELVLQSPDDPSLLVPVDELWEAPESVMARFDDAEDVLLLTLRRAARVWPPINRLLAQTRPSRLELSDGEVDDLLGPVVDGLASAGLFVQWPTELLSPLDVRPTISTPQVEKIAGSGLSLDVILGWRASVDGLDLTEQELEQLASAKRGVVELRGRWVKADPASLRRLASSRDLSAGEALGVALGGSLMVEGEVTEAEVVGPLADLGQRLRSLDFERDQAEPDGLDAELRPYQRRGLAWMAEMTELGLGGILADDMGLGKTIQFLALHLHRTGRAGPEAPGAPDGNPASPPKPTLVVCPATLVANWEREAARFTPSVTVRRYHGPDRSLDDLAPGELVVTTYGVVRRDRDALASIDWGLVAADEAQAIKNPLSRTARAMRDLDADARFALTGTPVENQLTELWAICDWTTPRLLGSMERFRRDVATPIERDRDPEVTRWLSTLIRPFVLRRRKADPGIAPDLPPKTETDRVISLTAEQTTLYKAVVDESLERIEQSDGMQRRGLVLKLLTALKQICNHPAHYLGQTGPLAGRSNKLEALTDLLGIVGQEGASALVFTQYVTMGRLLQSHLDANGIRASFLHGSLGLRARQDLVDGFQAGESDVFILSLKAGGTGLNLTRATHVVHYDRWWNPAVEDQASDRAWRIGQDKPVQIHRLVCEGTIEDRIAELLATKRDLAEQVVGGSEAWVSELSDADLAALVELSAPTPEPDPDLDPDPILTPGFQR